MLNYNNEQLELVSSKSTGVFEAFKDVFVPLRRLVDIAGNNEATQNVKEQATRVEKCLNEVVLENFNKLREAIAKACSNREAFERAVRSLEPVSLTAVTSVEVKDGIKPFGGQ
jgi:hypothetical protein